MCGIFGVWHKLGSPASERVVRARDTMRHRGPDDAGVFIDQHNNVALAQRRLSIVDLSSAGHQPMLSDDKSLAIVFNGEIYNFRELRGELLSLGYSFRSECDTEVLLHGYAEWGRRLPERLNGMFAFAVLEKSSGRLFLARDRAGEKPLFLYSCSEFLAFASEAKAILEYGVADRHVELDTLNTFLAYGYVPGQECLIGGCMKVPPGYICEIESGRVSMYPYWRLESPRCDSHRASSEQLLEQFHALLTDSVRRQLVADVPVGVLLSGGIDSSLITAIASKCCSGRLKTFTVTFPGHVTHNESEHARLIAEAFGTEHYELEGSDISVSLFERLAVQYDEPMADSSMLPTAMVSELVRSKCAVALGGDGGDELFGGYQHYPRTLTLMRLAESIPSTVRRSVGRIAENAIPVGLRGRNYLSALGQCDRDVVPFPATRFDPVARRLLLSGEAWSRLTLPLLPELSRSDLSRRFTTATQQLLGTDFLTYLPDDILVKVDRASMLSSLEVRAPILDYRIIEFAFQQVGDHLKVDADGNKKLLPKMLARRLLPTAFNTRRKQGFSVPLSLWLRTKWKRHFGEYIATLPREIFNVDVALRMLKSESALRVNAERIYALAQLAIWLKHYGFRVR